MQELLGVILSFLSDNRSSKNCYCDYCYCYDDSYL